MTVKQAYTANASMMEITQVKNPFIPFSLKGFVRNSMVLSPAIQKIGVMAIAMSAMTRKSLRVNHMKGNITTMESTRQIVPSLSKASILCNSFLKFGKPHSVGLPNKVV